MSQQPSRGRMTVIRYFQKKAGRAPLLPQSTDAALPARVPRLTEIERDGMGAEVLRLRRQGEAAWRIGQERGYSKAHVQHFIRMYNALNPHDRSLTYARSIYDLTYRLQEKLEDLEEARATASGLDGSTPNPELELKLHKLEMDAIKMGQGLVERLEKLKSREKFENVVLDLLDTFEPGTKAKALKALSEMSDGIASLRAF